MAIYIFYFLFWKNFYKTIYNSCLLGFFISCLLRQIFWSKGMKCPQQVSRNIFILKTTNHFALKTILCLPFERSRLLKTFKTSTNQYLVSNYHFYMVNPCCDDSDVTKTTVNEIKNVSKMADISLLQVKIFQELSTIWKIGKIS
jgi:transcriptional regulator of met regulon